MYKHPINITFLIKILLTTTRQTWFHPVIRGGCTILSNFTRRAILPSILHYFGKIYGSRGIIEKPDGVSEQSLGEKLVKIRAYYLITDIEGFS